MNNGIIKLFMSNVNNEQINIIKNLLEIKGWMLCEEPSIMYGIVEGEEWWYFSFKKNDEIVTIHIGVSHCWCHKPVFFYELNYRKKNRVTYSEEFTDLDDYEYYFNKILNTIINNNNF